SPPPAATWPGSPCPSWSTTTARAARSRAVSSTEGAGCPAIRERTSTPTTARTSCARSACRADRPPTRATGRPPSAAGSIARPPSAWTAMARPTSSTRTARSTASSPRAEVQWWWCTASDDPDHVLQLGEDRVRRRRPQVAPRVQAPDEQLVERFRDARGHRPRERQADALRLGPGMDARQQVVQHGGHRIEVSRGVELGLGGAVALVARQVVGQTAETEVGDLDDAARDHDVRRLDRAVDDVPAVQEGQDLGERAAEGVDLLDAHL